ncbi:ectonucleotide pyrophosphatase/phosphodiesterase [Myroides sp. M-43]|uniref:alkaline phosphatase family protein n=1 Tax=Myroides oncorhynchi TaxID=2893756 RepID=UPI001E4AB610|nr:ectonucleotide pyrophosphatase/phosphodiesterase [Myroides oncorhynchi]MCC9044273.1 ectonucleotide pyrophosphatase/phosphodiesterase [Myroides oncorhynchi]
MKKIWMVIGLLCSLTATVVAKEKIPHVILITIDGFRPNFYLEEDWGMHTVRKLMKNGVAAKAVTPIFPSVTYPDHTTIITGEFPSKHGIVYNNIFDPASGSQKWYWDYSAIQIPTLYDVVKQKQMTSANVIWPVTVNAPIDYNVPDIWDLNNGYDRRSITALYTTPYSLWREIQNEATGTLRAEDWTMTDEELIMDENIARMGSYMIQKYNPNFLTLHFPCTDHYEHQDGLDSPLVRASVAGADRAIKTIIEALDRSKLKDNYVVIITGDHGFEKITHRLQPNVWLKEAGLLNDAKAMDWDALFHAQGGSAFLRVQGKDKAKTVEKVKALLEKQPQQIRSRYRILSKHELQLLGADPEAELALTGLNHTTFGGGVKGEVFSQLPKEGGAHGFLNSDKSMQTGFVAFGKGVKKGVVLDQMALTDISPLISELMQLDFKTLPIHLKKQLLIE